MQHAGVKRAATEGHIHQYPRRDQESMSSAHSTPGVSWMCQRQNYPSDAYHPSQLTSHAPTTPSVNYGGGDSYPEPVQGDFMFQNLVL